MRSYYTSINNQQVHFLKAGKGAPIALFHASPQSAKMLAPFLQELAPHFSVIAPDTPGYGASAPLAKKPKDIAAYCKFFHQFFKAIGLKKVALYGTATGAQIAIRYALMYPKMVSHLYLDNAAHFTDEQREKMLAAYFPDTRPKYDGSHLLTVWTMVRDLFTFFPWCLSEKQYRLKVPFPPSVFLHQVATQYFQAGEHYALAYKAAFAHEQAANVQQLKVPTTIFDWKGSIIRPYTKQLLNFDLPATIRTQEIPADRGARFTNMQAAILATYTTQQSFELPKTISKKPLIKQPTPPAFIKKLPPLVPDENGTYLINAWFYLRDRQIYKNTTEKSLQSISNRTPNFDPSYLQQLLIHWMNR